MKFPIRQVLLAFFGLAFVIVILERAGGFSQVSGSVFGGAGDLFAKLTPSPAGRGLSDAVRGVAPRR